ncbi:MAG: efflux RND transporter periplasmic adaptor subunit [Succinivibrionaceae bacterium]|nr:efflux RND transporter periplasmic adaptor subunit [Succinivibrionaceae bacterium]
MKKLIAILILASVLAGVCYWRFAPEPEARRQYMTIKVKRGDIVSGVEATGTLEGSKQVSVGAQVSGQLQKLYVDTGDEVKAGMLLAQIDSRTQENSLKDAQAQLSTYRAQLNAAKASLKKAQLEYRRQERLSGQNAGARADFEAAEAALESARAQVTVVEQQIQQAIVKVDTAKINVGYTQISAPIDGVVIAVVTDEGQTVVSNQTASTILKLAKMDTMTVKAEISEADVVKVRPGMKVNFTILGQPYRTFTSVLKKVEPAPSSAASTTTTSSSSSSSAIYYNAEFDIPNDDRTLRVSMTAECRIILDEHKNALLIPISSLRGTEGENRYRVSVLKNNRPASVIVQTGLRDQSSIEVLSGLEENDLLILGDDVETAENAAMANEKNKKRRGPPRL